MSTLFLVVAHGGRYDEAWSNPEIASTDKAKLEAYIADKESNLAYCKAIQAEYWRLTQGWRLENPSPKCEMPTQKTWPSFAGLRENEITQEMRDHRAAIKAENTEAIRIAYIPETEWHAQYKAFQDELIAEKGWSSSDIRRTVEDRYWVITEIEVI